MSIAALIAWLCTAAGGFVMLGLWISKGGHRTPGASRFSPALIFGHFGLAALGLVVWIIYLFAGENTLAWVAFVLLLPVAALGFTMLARWLPTYRTRTAAPATAPADSQLSTGLAPPSGQAVAERHFPVAVVGAHGVFAALTLVLVLLAALGVGTS